MKKVRPVIDNAFLRERPLSASSLKQFRKSPKHYIHYITQPRATSDAFAMGNAVECLILEPTKFDDKFEVYTKFSKRSNADKEKWALMCENASKESKTLLDSEAYAEAKILSSIALDCEEFKPYIDSLTKIQKKLSWTHKETGLPVIGYVDMESIIEEHVIITDIKTSAKGEPKEWFKQAGNLDYELQVGSYLMGYHRKFYQFPDFMFLVIDKEAPYDAYMVHCPPDYCQDAKDEFDQTLTAFKYCMDNDQFDMGYMFWHQTMPYISMEKPRYIKSKFVKQ